MGDKEIRSTVRERYGERAKVGTPCCGASRSCCGPQGSQDSVSAAVGYSEEQLNAIPEGADLGLGCGNPTALASLKEGETVLDLGSGAGIDCFLAARAVGPSGRAIGVDMTAEMLDRARENARANRIHNVEFRLGEIEHLPVADGAVDVVISNCVVNLSPDKPQVFREAFRALKPSGRMFLSDIVLLKALPEAVKTSIEAYVGCVAGASMKTDYLAAIEAAGFQDVEVLKEVPADAAFSDSAEPKILVDGQEVDPESLGLDREEVHQLAGTISSITVKAVKSESHWGKEAGD
jgi:arsenite methyltransferase